MGGRKQTANNTEEPTSIAGPETQPATLAEGQAAVVRKLLKKLEKQMGDGEVKGSLGDYIRLVQLYKELDEESPREIKVTWVESAGDKAEKKEFGNEE